MKTAEEFFEEISASEQLRGMIANLENEEELKSFLKDHDCGASVEEFMKCVASRDEGEISEEDAEAVAGGVIDMKMIRRIMEMSWEVTHYKPRVPRDPSADLGHH